MLSEKELLKNCLILNLKNIFMKENVGKKDRIMRSLVGPALMVVGYTTLEGCKGKFSGLATMIFGALIIESAITKVCPLNAAFGIDTREKRHDDPITNKSNKASRIYIRRRGISISAATARMLPVDSGIYLLIFSSS